jgi:hypothetical protein
MSDISPELYESLDSIAVVIDQPLGTYDITLENASGVSTSVEVSSVPYVAPAEPENNISPELYESLDSIAVVIDQPLGTYDITLENAYGVSTSVEVSSVPYVAPAEPENNIAPDMYPGYYVPVIVPSSASLGDATVRTWTGSEYTDTIIQVVKANVPDPGPNTYDITPDKYKFDDDGSFYIVTSKAGVGINTLVFTNQSGSGTADFTVLNAIDNIESGGTIISPVEYNIGANPEIIDENTPPLDYDPYTVFNATIPEGTGFGPYSLRISNLSGTSEGVGVTVEATSDVVISGNTIPSAPKDGTVVGKITTSNTDGESVSYTILSQTVDGFYLDNDTLRTRGLENMQIGNVDSFQVVVRATVGGDSYLDKPFIISWRENKVSVRVQPMIVPKRSETSNAYRPGADPMLYDSSNLDNVNKPKNLGYRY